MIVVRFKIPINPKNRDELVNAIRSISQDAKKEEGCLDNFIFQNVENENELILLEAWKTMNFLKKHWKTFNFSALLGTRNLLSRPMEVEINKVAKTQGLEDIEKIRAGKKVKQTGKRIKVAENFFTYTI